MNSSEKMADKWFLGSAREWARVELWRWQYGHLPEPGDRRKLNIPKALRAMASALNSDSAQEEKPHPRNVAAVLDYVAEVVSSGGGRNPNARPTRNQAKTMRKKIR